MLPSKPLSLASLLRNEKCRLRPLEKPKNYTSLSLSLSHNPFHASPTAPPGFSASINSLWISLEAAVTIPLSRSSHLPFPKSSAAPAASVTAPPASRTSRAPGAWSQIFSR